MRFNFPIDEQFELEINYKQVKYEFLVRLSSSKEGLICFGPAAYNPDDFSPPIYIRHSWHEDFESSTIFYNDPTTYNFKDYQDYRSPNHRGGWGVGKLDDYYLENIGKIIKILAEHHHIGREKIIFFGSSSGGFCSIMLATLLKTPIVVVNNPQTILKPDSNNFKDLIDCCFQGREENIELYKHRFNVVEMFKKEKFMPNIIYFINIRSPIDLNSNCIPLIESLPFIEFSSNKLEIIMYSDDLGHMGFYPKEETIKFLEDLLDSKGDKLKLMQIESFKSIEEELKLKKKQIAELQTFRGYINYKTRNIYLRTNKKLKNSLSFSKIDPE